MKYLLALLALLCLAAPASAEDEVALLPGCQWRAQTVMLDGKSDRRLAFRYQACDGTGAAKVTFTLTPKNILEQTWDGTAMPAAQFWLLGGEKPSAMIDKVARPLAPPEERSRCVVRLDYIEHRYHFEPDAAFMEELLARDEPFSACGDLGATNDAIQYFAVIDNTVLAFFWIGQDTPLFDPASFRYLK